jgi:outer membrane receptor protein involved in Fe transport
LLITANPSAATLAALYADPNFANLFGIPASAIAYVIDARNANLARNHLDGIDFDLGYHTLRGGAFEIGASGTWLFHLTQQFTATSPVVEALGTIGNPVRYRVRGRASLQLGSVGFAGFVNHTAGYANTAVSPVEHAASWTTVDVQLSKTFGEVDGPMRGTRLSLSVTNLFDRDPPYVNNRTPYSASGFDPEQASAAGRVIALQLVKAW